jgi:uncharacterized protein YaeQ
MSARVPAATDGRVVIPVLGYANHATWQEHMEWATRGLPENEKTAMYEKYGPDPDARDVTPNA